MLSESNIVKTIYHIGDIHIRKNNDRDKEYADVFKRTCDEIAKSKKNALVVCVGDIFHDGLSPTAIILAKNFFMNLCEICDVVVFRGNHDQATKSNSESMDFLFPILYKLETKNKIHILDKTGFYEYGNIVFGYTDVYDQHVFKMEGYDEKIKIGLWHGTISGSKNDAGMDLSDHAKFTVDDFDGYDYVMLGDIHKTQYINKNKTIAYCGSLIQQNHGESLTQHGYIRWDLAKKTSKFVNIDNDYGYVTIEIKDDKVNDLPDLPQNVNLRIIHSGSSEEYIKSVYTKVSDKSIIVNFEDKKEQNEFIFSDVKADEVHEVNNDETTVERLTKYIEDNYDDYTEEDKKEIESILRKVISGLDYNYDTHKKSIKLKSLMFNNFNVYGGGNCIDYSSMKGIINVCGKNGIGKSSVAVHVLLYAIYGLCEESSVGRYDYINNKKNNMMTSIILDVNGAEYRIYRTSLFKDKKRTTRNFTHNVIFYKNGVDISGKDVSITNKLIIDTVGSSDDLINLCIMEQKKSSSFLNLTDIEKKDYICNLLKLDIYNNIHDVLTQEARAYNAEMMIRNKRIYDDPKNKMIDRSELINRTTTEMGIKLEEIIGNEKNMTEKFNAINKEKIEKDMQITELNTINFDNISTEKDILTKIHKNEKLLLKLQQEKDEVMSSIEKNNKKLEKYKGVEKKKKLFDKNKEKEIETLSNDINELWKGFIKIDDTQVDIDSLITENEKLDAVKIELGKRMEQLEIQMAEIKHDIEEYDKNETVKTGYSKYNEMIEENVKIDNKEKIIRSKIDDISVNLKKKKRQYEKTKKELELKTQEILEIRQQMNGYSDMDEKNEAFKSDKSKRISMLMSEIQEHMKTYEKTADSMEDINENNMIRLQSENNKLTNELNSINDKIVELNNKLEDIEDVNIDTKYDLFIKFKKIYEESKLHLETSEKKLKEYLDHSEMLKNHKYNVNCEVCMSNDITKDKITTKERIESLEEQIVTLKKTCGDNHIKFKKYEKYNAMKEAYLRNQEVSKQINMEIKLKENLLVNIDANELKIKMLTKQHLEYIDNIRKIKSNKKIDVLVKKNNEKIKKIQEEKFDDYDIFCGLREQERDMNNTIVGLNGDIQNYERLLQDESEQNEKLSNIDVERKQIEKKYGKYKKYGEMYRKNEENIILLSNLNSERNTSINDMEKVCMKSNTIAKELKEHDKYLEILKSNGKIKRLINKKTNELELKKKEVYDEYVKYTKLTDSNGKLNTMLSNMQVQIKDIEMILIKIKREYSDNADLIKKKSMYDTLMTEIINVNEQFSQISSDLESLKKDKLESGNRLFELKSELNAVEIAKKENIETERKKQIVLRIIDIIKNGFVENLLTKKIIPNFCASVNDILTSFVNYKISMEYENKKLCVYKEDSNGLLSCASKLSGYETLMANIAFRLAINNINKLYKTNFFVIDEAFAFCDELSITKISNLFTYMRNIYDFVIVVSHNEQIKSYTDIDIPIQIKNGYSYVNMINDKNKSIFSPYMNLFEQTTDEDNETDDKKKTIKNKKISGKLKK